MHTRSTRRRLPPTPRSLIEAAQRGDRRAQHEMICRYEPLVQSVTRKLRPPPHLTHDDLAQEARIGVLAAIRNWRAERGAFPAFARQCARNQALLALERATTRKQQLITDALPLDTGPVCFLNVTNDEIELTLINTLPAPADAHTDPVVRLLVREELTAVVEASSTIYDHERAALAGAIAGESYQQLGPRLGRTPKAASHAAYRARCKLAAALPRAA